jgi:hypothetical protein
MCKYGSSCYRKSAAHLQQFRHDADDAEEEDGEGDDGEEGGSKEEEEEASGEDVGEEEDEEEEAYVPEAGEARDNAIDLRDLNRWNRSVLRRKLSRGLSTKSVTSVASADTIVSPTHSVVSVAGSNDGDTADASAAAAIEYAAAGYKFELVHARRPCGDGDDGSGGTDSDPSNSTNLFSGVPLAMELDPRVGRVVLGRARNHSSSSGAGAGGSEEYVCVAPDGRAPATALAAAATLSRRHAVLVWRAGEWWVENLYYTLH